MPSPVKLLFRDSSSNSITFIHPLELESNEFLPDWEFTGLKLSGKYSVEHVQAVETCLEQRSADRTAIKEMRVALPLEMRDSGTRPSNKSNLRFRRWMSTHSRRDQIDSGVARRLFDPRVIEWRVIYIAKIERQLRGQLIPYPRPKLHTDHLKDLCCQAESICSWSSLR